MRYHLKLNRELLNGAKIALLPGDPDRIPLIARLLDHPVSIGDHREWRSFRGAVGGIPLLAVSTGVGGPATSICVDELAQLGVTTFIRVGTSGSIQDFIRPGDLVVTTASVRMDGASRDFAPIEYPAVSDFDITEALTASARALGHPCHTGITASTDTFYQGQERYSGFSRFLLPRHRGSLEIFRALNVLNYEMESATLFTMCAAMGLRAGCVTGVIADRTTEESVNLSALKTVQVRAAEVAVNAVGRLTANHLSKC